MNKTCTDNVITESSDPSIMEIPAEADTQCLTCTIETHASTFDEIKDLLSDKPIRFNCTKLGG